MGATAWEPRLNFLVVGQFSSFPLGERLKEELQRAVWKGQKDDYDGKMKADSPPSSLTLAGAGENEDHPEGSLNLLQGGIE